MDKIDCKTADFGEENAAKLIKLFPECEGERGMVDLEKLRQVLSSSVVDGDVERYQFTWPGKRKAMAAANAATTKTLRPAIPESVGRDGTAGKFDSENLYIEGDNLEALKLLQCNYAGKVKMIYIDPPYNTGHDFVYRDRFSLTDKELAQEGGAFDEDGNRFEKNDSAEARYHSNWCSMMYPRLKLARNLLRDDGVLFMSIDDNEVVNARKLCDEVFGESNFVAQFTWAAGRKNDSKHVSVSHEYIVTYFKNTQYIVENKIIWRERKQGLDDIYAAYDSFRKQFGSDNAAVEKALKSWYSALPDGHPAKDHSHYNKVDNKGVFFASDISWPGGGGPKYEILHPVTQEPVKIPSRGWITNSDTMKQWIAEGRVHFGEDESAVPTIKSYLREHETGVPYSVFYKDGRAASKRLKTLLGDKVFENPKDEEILKRLLEFSGVGKNDLVLDFFSGSGTTAHALMLAEAENPLGRKFILVQLPEVIDPNTGSSEKVKKIARNAATFLDSIKAKHTICEIAKERIRRAGKKIMDEFEEKKKAMALELPLSDGANAPVSGQELDIGFRVLKIDSSSLDDVSATVGETKQMMFDKLERIKSDRTPEDILFQLLIETHIPLSDPIARVKVGGNEVFFVGVEADDFRQDLQDSQDLGSGDNPVNPVNHVQKIYESAPLVACLDRSAKLTNEFFLELAAFKPGIAFFRDDAFNDDAARINVEQIFKQNSSNTIIKVI